MRLDIRYITAFRYDTPVAESQNELRACPATDQHQWLVHYHVTTSPSCRVLSYLDHWGTRVDTFGIRLPHHELEVVAEATVETTGPVALPAGIDPAAFRDEVFRDERLEYLQRSPHVDWGPQIDEAARAAVAGLDDGVAMVQAIHDLAAGLEYRTGQTEVGVSVDDVFAAGHGVCQDIAHLAIAGARAVGIPARYVSGYLFAVDDATGADGGADQVEVQTHAWVEFALPGHGWFAMDPTNTAEVGEQHVTIGRGRDYDDVAPMRGVFSGGTTHELEVSVTMRRLALEPLGDAVDPRRARAAAQQ